MQKKTYIYAHFSDNICIKKNINAQECIFPHRNTTNHLLCSLAKDEQHGINNVALPPPIWSHHRGKALKHNHNPRSKLSTPILPSRAQPQNQSPPHPPKKEKREREFLPSEFFQRQNQFLKNRKKKANPEGTLTLWKGPTRCSPA